MAKSFDVIILGGGPAGYVCAIRCAQLGLKTVVVEREKLGGVCVNVGCIPSKALLHSAHLANVITKDAKRLGVKVGNVSLDFGAAVKHSRQVSEQNSKGVGFLLKKNNVTVVSGTGTLLPDKAVTTTYTAPQRRSSSPPEHESKAFRRLAWKSTKPPSSQLMKRSFWKKRPVQSLSLEQAPWAPSSPTSSARSERR